MDNTMKNFSDYFEIIKFATPETNVRFKENTPVPKSEDIIIKKCMCWEDIMHLQIADDILTRAGIFVKWYVPYKPFARQDRTTSLLHANESEHLKNILFRLDERLIFLDVHSDNEVLGVSISQFKVFQFYGPLGEMPRQNRPWLPTFHLIVPDAGAAKKIPGNFASTVTFCQKTRDPVTGALSGFNVPEITTTLPMVLFDDICDGGGTFIGIAEHLQQYRKNNKLILYVTHGLFTKGIVELSKFFDQIITTNSVFESNEQNSNVLVLDVLSDDFVSFGLKQI